jgi:hypothetical protein
MAILPTISSKCNRKHKINFDGGDISSDGGFIFFQEFLSKIGFTDLLRKVFKTKGNDEYRKHSDAELLLQVIYQAFSGYMQDDCADELRHDPVMTTLLEKEDLASQPTISRFFNRMDEDTIEQFNQIMRALRKIAYGIKPPEHILLDLDSTLLNTYGNQEGQAFNYHYRDKGYHPLLCFDALTGLLFKAMLRAGNVYCSNGAAEFMNELLTELQEDFPETLLYMRGDSGFASPEIYETLEGQGCRYVIRLKDNPRLQKQVAYEVSEFIAYAMRTDPLKYSVTYGEFMYQADSWNRQRRVAYKIEKPAEQMDPRVTFIVTSFEDISPTQVVQLYCGRGKMENFIKECKNGFGFNWLCSSREITNANRLQAQCIAYNLVKCMQNLVFPQHMKKHHINTIRIKLVKIAVRIVRKARNIFFKLSSSCPYKREFYSIMDNIWNLKVQLE